MEKSVKYLLGVKKKYIDLLKEINNKNEKNSLKKFIEDSILKYNKTIEDKVNLKKKELLSIYNL